MKQKKSPEKKLSKRVGGEVGTRNGTCTHCSGMGIIDETEFDCPCKMDITGEEAEVIIALARTISGHTDRGTRDGAALIDYLEKISQNKN